MYTYRAVYGRALNSFITLYGHWNWPSYSYMMVPGTEEE